MSSVVILSPHFDDAPLSLGAALLNRAFGADPEVSVVFSVSCYAKHKFGDAQETTAVRTAEELEASLRAGYHTRFLGFPEPFVRAGFNRFQDIFDTHRPAEDEPIWQAVKVKIEEILAVHGRLTISPLGCGGHIDHRIVYGSVVASAASRGALQVGFYEDLPYAAGLSDENIRSRLPQLTRRSYRPVILGGDIQKKLQVLEVYQSQLEEEDLMLVRRHWERIGGERIWLPTGPLTFPFLVEG